MNIQINNNNFIGKTVYGIGGLLIAALIVFLLKLSMHSWISLLKWI